jgi:hypothetical protein
MVGDYRLGTSCEHFLYADTPNAVLGVHSGGMNFGEVCHGIHYILYIDLGKSPAHASIPWNIYIYLSNTRSELNRIKKKAAELLVLRSRLPDHGLYNNQHLIYK